MSKHLTCTEPAVSLAVKACSSQEKWHVENVQDHAHMHAGTHTIGTGLEPLIALPRKSINIHKCTVYHLYFAADLNFRELLFLTILLKTFREYANEAGNGAKCQNLR